MQICIIFVMQKCMQDIRGLGRLLIEGNFRKELGPIWPELGRVWPTVGPCGPDIGNVEELPSFWGYACQEGAENRRLLRKSSQIWAKIPPSVIYLAPP